MGRGIGGDWLTRPCLVRLHRRESDIVAMGQYPSLSKETQLSYSAQLRARLSLIIGAE